MSQKYEFTGETKEWFGVTLHRIRAVAEIAALGVAVGDLGGWIEKEANLSQVYGNAWVSGNAQVYGSARVYGNAWVSGNAQVYGSARVYGNARVSPLTVAGLRWHITIVDTQMVIGCQSHDIAKWFKFKDAAIAKMDTHALEFWQKHKPMLQALCAETGRPFAKAVAETPQ